MVARLGAPGQAADFAGALYWYQRLAPRGVPLPAPLAIDLRPPPGSFPFMLLERLPGRDLGDEYPTLSAAQKRRLARRIARI